ncbi:MAG: ATP-dependent DNA ligase [Sporichthyaceae bacterium]
MTRVLLQALTDASAAVAATSSRSAKAKAIATCLREASPGEIPIAVAYLAGELLQRRTGLGPAALRDLPAPAPAPTLDLVEVDAAFAALAELSGAGSATARREAFGSLLARATHPEQRLLAGLVSGELRQGALDGVMLEAVALAAELPAADVRRAVMFAGAVGPVAAAALEGGVAGLTQFVLQVGRPVRPMLAQPGTDLADALERTGPAAVEWKLDGIRVQVHRDGSDVAVFTRSLDDITGRMPEVVAAVLALPVRACVLDGECIALRPDGRPLPFQETAARTARTAAGGVALSPFFFDVLHLDGADLLGEDSAARRAALEAVAPGELLVPRIAATSLEVAEEFQAQALARGHEGVVVKALDAPYDAGRRGGAWVKVKPRHTLDLVVLAVEWGSGRRKGRLSNLHLGARDPVGGFVMLGKTFKGLTDATLQWQTEQLLARAVGPTTGWVVTVRPELVVEIAFDGVQTSPRYPGGMALRFARVLRYRPDKTAAEADTVDTVRAIHARSTG